MGIKKSKDLLSKTKMKYGDKTLLHSNYDYNILHVNPN